MAGVFLLCCTYAWLLMCGVFLHSLAARDKVISLASSSTRDFVPTSISISLIRANSEHAFVQQKNDSIILCAGLMRITLREKPASFNNAKAR